MKLKQVRQDTMTEREKAVLISNKEIQDKMERAKLNAMIEDGNQEAAMKQAKIMLNT